MTSARCRPFCKKNESKMADKPDDFNRGLKKSSSKRKNCCPFCFKVITNFMRHLTTKHGNEDKVKEYLSICDNDLNERKRKRQIAANDLRAAGNYKHNKDAINNNCVKELLPVKRPKNSKYIVNNKTHISCRYCLGFFKKESFYVHLRICKKFENRINEDNKRRNIRNCSELLVPDTVSINDYLKEHVFPTMYKDEISIIAQSDPLILKFANRFQINHKEKNQVKYISCKLRDLAKLFLHVKNFTPTVTNLADCLTAPNFDSLMEAVRTMCGYDKTTGICNVPSVTSRLRSSLVSCANILRIETMKHPLLTEDEKKQVYGAVDDFFYLLNHEWSVQVSACAEKSKRLSKVSKTDILPDSNDIKIFCSYLDEKCDESIIRLQKNPTYGNFEILTKFVIAYIITLNRRRPGEVVSATLKCYKTLNDNEDFGLLEETVLSKEDIDTFKNLSIFYIPANKNRKKVPIILTDKMKNVIDILISCRETLNINSDLLFPRPHSESIYDGTEIITEIKKKVKLKKPEHFTATGLRHHAATSTQLHHKDDTYTKNLAKFLGHTVQTHKDYYEMPLPLIQKVLVGKKLLQMTIQDSDNHVSEISPTSQDSENCFSVGNNCNEDAETTNANDSDIYIPNCEEKSNSDSDGSFVSSPVKKSKKVRWSKEEKEIIYKNFGRSFLMNQSPRRKEIKIVWEQEPLLQNKRTLQQVCTYVNNIVTKKCKILTPDKNRIKKQYL